MYFGFQAVYEDSEFALSAGIYSDFCVGCGYVETATSRFQQGFIAISALAAVCRNSRISSTARLNFPRTSISSGRSIPRQIRSWNEHAEFQRSVRGDPRGPPMMLCHNLYVGFVSQAARPARSETVRKNVARANVAPYTSNFVSYQTPDRPPPPLGQVLVYNIIRRPSLSGRAC